MRQLRNLILLPALITLTASAAHAGMVVTFTKAFSPSTIGPGSVSTLTFTISNPDPMTPLSDLAFMDVLPAGVTIATPPQALSLCGGTLSAPAGGSTITFSGGMLGTSSSCTITVDVTSSTPGTHMNASGPLTSSVGSHGAASADLTVATDRPGFLKSFSPSSVSFGGTSTLTFIIDNTLNASSAFSATFSDTFPTGMAVADPANVMNGCGGTFSATPGSGTVSLSSGGTVGAGTSCFISVDVVGGAVGMLGNTSGDLTTLDAGFFTRSSGKAGAVLTVTGGASESILLTKEFTDDPVPPGGTVTLRFTIANTSRDDTATAIAFTDDLTTALAGLIFTSVVSNTCDATPTGTGTSTISFSGGSLAPEASCTFRVTVTVPGGATPGTYTNTSSTITATVGGDGVTGSSASALLFVVSFPVLTKEFTDDPVGAGGTVTLEFTITNPETTSAMSSVEFLDELTDGSGGFPPDPTSGFLPFPVSVGLPPTPDPPCGPGSSLALVFVDTDRQALELTGGSLAANDGMPGGPDTCTFTVTVDIPTGLAPGTYTNHTEQPTAVLDSFPGPPTVTGKPAKGDVVVVAAPQLTKEFTDDPAMPGGTVTLLFTLENNDPDNAASAIAFSDDLGAALTGLTLASVMANGCGGTVSGVGTTMFGYSGGTLAAGATCTIELSLTVPGTPPGGTFPNTTSDVSATVLGVTAESPAASDDLAISGLQFTKAFSGDPVIAGGTATLTFTIDNTAGTSPADDATSLFFSDDLDAVIPGLVATLPPTPDPPCGAGSALVGFPVGDGGTLLFLIGGDVPGGTLCSFSVTVTVPATIPDPPGSPIPTPDGAYLNVTSSLSAIIGGMGFVLPPATDLLEVESNLLSISKSFTDDPVTPGGTVTLEITITNLSGTETITGIGFSDDLSAALSGLTATGATSNDCGGMATSVFPTGVFTYAGGTLMPGASCTIALTVSVPAAPLASSPPFVNTITDLTGKVGMLDVFGNSAKDRLKVQLLTLSKSFVGPTTATGTAVLSFTITNLDAANAASDLSFSDNLGAVIPGLTATLPPAPSPPCGAGSSLAGTSFLTLSGANLVASGTCTFSVTVNVPASAPPGTFPNTTSALFQLGLSVADPATANLVIEPPPTFAKSFAPDPILAGTTSTLTFTINNTASSLAASSLVFTDTLPTGVVVATPAVTSNTCGGTLTATGGASVISLTGGSVAAMTTCTVTVVVTSAAVGAHVNTTTALTSSSGTSGTATDTLTVNAAPTPVFSKSFAPDPIDVAGTSKLTFTINNTASALAATALAFTDNLPAGVVVATPANASNGCGGTLTATAGTGVISLTGGSVASGMTCTVEVDVTGTVAGTHVNTTGALTSSLGSSGTATDTLTVSSTMCFTGPTATGTGNATTCFLEQTAGCGFTSISYIPLSGNPLSPPAGTAPPELAFNHGLVTFIIGTGCTPGFTATLTFTAPAALPANTEYWKYGPTPANPTPHWYQIPATISGSTVTFEVTDGGFGDDDLMANGTIVDQGGPAVPAAMDIPTLSEKALILLAGLLALAALAFLRRQVG